MSIIEWYKGKNVLLSGGTGFMGKVLIEKLLRHCPEIGTIYVLCRSKRGLTSGQRIADFAKIPLFAPLLKERPNALSKLKVVDGDITEVELGLKPEIKQELFEKVNIVFHFAASLKLEAGLKEATQFNVKGTLSMLQLATNIKHLEVFLHLSTAFCHCEEEVLEEKLYDPIYCPYDVLSAVEWMSDKMLDTISPELLGPNPNCYTFTKRLAEGLMAEYGKKIPIAVVRPSIVVPSMRDPVSGWVDSLNGPIGVMAAAGKGVLRSMLCKPDYNAELVPVDVAISLVMLAACKRATTKSDNVSVYNVSSGETLPMSWGELVSIGKGVIRENPYNAGLWYPGGTIRTNPYVHALVVFFCQLIPAYLIDFIMFLTRNKRFMVRVQNRISLGMDLLQYFTMRQWIFTTKKTIEMHSKLLKEEKAIFYLPEASEVDVRDLIKDAIIGSRVYCLKEPLETLPTARRHLIWLYWLDKISQLCLLLLLGWLMLRYVPFLQKFANFILPEFVSTTLLHKVNKATI